ncbi:translation initiation factor eIF4E, partial [Podila horticola]
MTSRRQSRGQGDAPMLRPNYVFPPVKEGVASSSPSPTTTHTTTGESSTTATLAPPVVLEPKSQHLKTHYRTHSRNGSTVTVQDLKQAIAAVASSQLDPPPAEVEAPSEALSAMSLALPSTSDTATPQTTTTDSSPSVDAVSDPVVPAYRPYRPPGSRLRAAESETKTETKPSTEEAEKAVAATATTPDLESDSSSLRTRKPVPPPLILSTGTSEKAKAAEQAPSTATLEGSSTHSSLEVIKPIPQTPSRILTSHATPRLISSRSENGEGMFSPRTGPGGREGTPDYFSMRPLQPPRTPMTPGGDFGDDDDDYYGRLHMVTTPMIQNGFFPNWAKGDAQLEELDRIRKFLSARQYPDDMPLSDEWTLFFSDTSRAKDKTQVQDAYSSAITPLFSCHTVPQFATSWKYVRERVRPATMKVNQNLHWFKKGIKPMWEDPRNKYGGRLTICPPRAQLDLVWETVLILMAGDVLDHHGEGTGA